MPRNDDVYLGAVDASMRAASILVEETLEDAAGGAASTNIVKQR